MSNENSRHSLQILGIILCFGALLAYAYVRTSTIYGFPISTTPFREYALPIGVLGVISIIASFFVNNISPKTIIVEKKENQVYCRFCGKTINKNEKYCGYCGKEQF
jgi:uncharacterized paraquat-inducible protein A